MDQISPLDAKIKVLVCGGRDYQDWDQFCDVLNAIPFDILVSGGATGADKLAERYAQETNTPILIYPADWGKHGRVAGPLRNRQMLDNNPDISLVVAFPGGSGTRNMTSYAANKRVKVLYV